MRALLQYRASPGFADLLEAARPDWLELEIVDENDAARFASIIGEVEVLLHVLEPVTAEVIARAAMLRLIQKIGVGVNTIDLEAARRRGIAVCNMPGSNTTAVVEMALGLMIAAMRRIPMLDEATRNGHGWSLDTSVFDSTAEIAGATVGLVGYGAIARALAPVLAALGARVVVATRRPPDVCPYDLVTIEELLRISDVVSLHVPLTDGTRNMIGHDQIATMKMGSVLINTARGGLVDEDALADALASGRLGAAGLDVFAGEPLPESSRLAYLENVVLAPHSAWLTPRTLAKSVAIAYENCRRVRDGVELINRVV